MVNDETTTPTPTHPFYGKDRGFVNARKLQAGDELVSVDSGTCIVENVYIEI